MILCSNKLSPKMSDAKRQISPVGWNSQEIDAIIKSMIKQVNFNLAYGFLKK